MKKKFVQIAALCLSAALLAATGGRQRAFAASSETSASGTTILVGLHYGTGAMEGLNLANETGSGFRFGYYDSSNQFVPLGSTEETAISVVETLNVYYGTYNGYTSYHSALTTSSVAVGDYHLELSGPYDTFAKAQAVAAEYEDGFPAWIGGEFFARIGNYTTRPQAVAAQNALAARGVTTVIKGTSEYGMSVVITGTNTILFQFDDLGKGTGLGVEPNAADMPADGPEDNPGDDPEDNPGDDPEDNPGDDPEDNPGDDPEDNPGDDPEDNPGDDPEDNPEDDPEDNPGDDPEDNPGDDPGDNPENNPEDDLENNPEDNPEGVEAYSVENDENGDEADSVKYTTWSHFYLYYGGFRFERVGGGSMTVVNVLDLEDYVKGVVPYEMSDGWPLEALKAQAVAARTYVLSLGTRHGGSHFDVCYSTHCQAYYGLNRAGSNSNAAVEQTAGQVVRYNGKLAQTVYYSSNGGASESASVVWGGSQDSYPYLVGKEDPYEEYAGVNNSYTRKVSSDTLVAGLKNLGYNEVGESIVSVAVVSLTDTGNPKQVAFTDNNGTQFTVSSRYVVSMLNLGSYRYGIVPGEASLPKVSVNGGSPADVDGLYAIDGNGDKVPVAADSYVLTGSGTAQLELDLPVSTGGGIGQLGSTGTNNGFFTFVGKGWGHNVGMSQWGAYAMARQGYTYLDILQFYYTGITVGCM